MLACKYIDVWILLDAKHMSQVLRSYMYTYFTWINLFTHIMQFILYARDKYKY
jgi:hypothetical protein